MTLGLTRIPRVDFLRRKGITYEEWLASGEPLPDGFKKWDGAYRHWDQWNPLGWAIYCYLNSKQKRS
jgi:hypothetical protein